MIAAVVLGLAIGLALGSLGGGGSILAVPVLVHLAGQSASTATATSLVAVGVASIAATFGHARSGNVRWRAAAGFVATGVGGSWAGASLNDRLDGDVLLLAFSVLVLVAAHRMLTACPSCTRVGERRAMAPDRDRLPELELAGTPGGSARASGPGRGDEPEQAGRLPARRRAAARGLLRIVLAGTVVGFLTGLFGVGGGFVIVPALALALGLSMPVAIGTSLAVIVGNATVALGFRGLDAVDWTVAVPFTATMLVGSTLGSLVAHRIPAQRSLRAFASFLVLVAVANGSAAAVALAS